MCLYHVIMALHFLNNVVNDVESYSLVLKVNKRVNLINLIPGSRFLISSLPGSASRMHVESLGKPRDSTSVFVALPGKLDIKRLSLSTLCL